jgi:hypothetical protein
MYLFSTLLDDAAFLEENSLLAETGWYGQFIQKSTF